MAGAVLLLGILPLLEKQAVANSESLFSLVIAINAVTVVVLIIPGWRARPANMTLQWLDVLLIGLIASGIVVLLNIKALETTTATHRSIFQAMYPAATAVFSFWLLQERLPRSAYIIIAIMIAGIILMSSRGISTDIAVGDYLLLATLPLMGFCDTWVKKSLTGLTPAWVALCRFAIGTLSLLVVGLAMGYLTTLPGQAAWGWILASGVCIGFGILLLYQGMALRGASLAAAMIGISPVITLVLEGFFLEVSFTTIELVGMALVVAGGVLLSQPGFQGNQAKKSESQKCER